MGKLLFGVLLTACACAGAADDPSPVASAPEPEPACDWTHTAACKPCVGRRDYGAGNTCEGVIWQARSATDFCLQSFPCDADPVPVTRLED